MLNLTQDQIKIAKYLLLDLHDNKLEVNLAEAPEPKHVCHKIRVVDSRNSDWYRKLFEQHEHTKRQRVERALRRMIQTKTCYYIYDYRCLIIINKYVDEGKKQLTKSTK